ncbi:hypothetical protein BC833DRAFT_587628 [Globomyces pollinis-pini]|nr:hypothetical protein BC833DRAFT_587628 [Globomyces pollinis-pini]
MDEKTNITNDNTTNQGRNNQSKQKSSIPHILLSDNSVENPVGVVSPPISNQRQFPKRLEPLKRPESNLSTSNIEVFRIPPNVNFTPPPFAIVTKITPTSIDTTSQSLKITAKLNSPLLKLPEPIPKSVALTKDTDQISKYIPPEKITVFQDDKIDNDEQKTEVLSVIQPQTETNIMDIQRKTIHQPFTNIIAINKCHFTEPDIKENEDMMNYLEGHNVSPFLITEIPNQDTNMEDNYLLKEQNPRIETLQSFNQYRQKNQPDNVSDIFTDEYHLNQEKQLEKLRDTQEDAIIAARQTKALLDDFVQFLSNGNTMNLLVNSAVILGGSFSQIVDSLVFDILTPILALLGNQSLYGSYWLLKCPTDSDGKLSPCLSTDFNTYQNANEQGAITLNYGSFVEKICNLLVISIILYILVRGYTSVFYKDTPSEDTQDCKQCQYCTMMIPEKSVVCSFCNSDFRTYTKLDKNILAELKEWKRSRSFHL